MKRLPSEAPERYGIAAKMSSPMSSDYWSIAKRSAFKDMAALDRIAVHWVPDNSAALVRVEVLEGKQVHIEAFEPLSIDLPPTGVYDLDAVPGWVRARIAALSIMPVPPPPSPVDEVGLRVSETVFWIIM